MRVLVTGAAGFVGSYLVPLLEGAGHEVFGLALGDSDRWISADLRNKSEVEDAVELASPEWVFHLAAQSSTARSWEDPAFTYEVNVTGTHHLLRALRESVPSCRVVVSGTSDGYGIVKTEDCPLTEDMPLRPASPYAVSKVAQESVAQMFHAAFGTQVVVARAFMHVGPGQAPTFATARWARQIAAIESGAEEPVLTVGNLEVQREFCDVRDVVEAYVALAERGEAGEVYNVATGDARPLREALDILLAHSSSEIEVEIDASLIRAGDPPILSGDPTKLERATGWSASHEVEETLREVLEYWRAETAGDR